MRIGFDATSRAISIFVVGIAFLFFGCQQKEVLKPAPARLPVPDHFDVAEQHFHARNFESALESYDLFLRQNPEGEKSRRALYRTAKIYNTLERFGTAISILKKIVRDYPDHPDLPVVLYELAITKYRSGDYESSKTDATGWIENYPEHALKGEVFVLLGKTLMALNDRPNSFCWLVRAKGAFNPSSPTWSESIDNILELIKNSPLEDLEEMVKCASGDDYAPHIYYRMASTYLDMYKLDEARTAAMALIRSTPEQTWVSIGRQFLSRIEEELSVKLGVVGCLLPLSGPFAIYGQEVLNGIQLGMGLFQGTPGEQTVELIIKDTGGKAEETVAAMEELIRREKVMAIIGPLTSKSSQAAAKKAQESGIPLITLTQREDITLEGDMVFRNFLTPKKEIQKLVHKSIDDLGIRRFAILYPDNPYGRFFMNLFWDKVNEMGGVITAVESYPPDETDFAVEIKKMVGLHYPRPDSVVEMMKRLKKPEEEPPDGEEPETEEEPEPIVDFDAVFIPDNHQQATLIVPQFPYHNIFNVRFLGTSLWQSPELLEAANEYVQGAIFPSGFFPESQSNRVKSFVELYRENFESEPGILAASGYDTIRVLKYVMGRAEIRTKKDFHRALSQNNNFYGVTGKISFDPQGEVEKEPILLTISGKRIQVLP